jgi:hypothetical protein
VAEAELAAKSADLVMRAEHAVRQEVAQHAREAREEQRLLQEEVVMAESRARALHASEEQKQDRTASREKSRESDHNRVYEAMLEKMQLGMEAINRQAHEERERMAREIRERDAIYMADARQKQTAIDQLTNALSAALARLNTEAGPAAGSGGGPPPPPPSGGGRALEGEEGKPRDRPKKKEATPLPAGSSGDKAPALQKARADPPPPPPEDDDDPDEGSEGDESE